MTVSESETWLIYAMGGGWGHLNRALALGRLAAREGRVKILTNNAYFSAIQPFFPAPEWEFFVLATETHFNRTCQQVQQIFSDQQFEYLIVDTFPRGLGGELAEILPDLRIKGRTLVHRHLNPEYVQAKNLEKFVENAYDLILNPGERMPLAFEKLPQFKTTQPWLIRNWEELPTREQACKILGLDPLHLNSKVVLILASGRPDELLFYGRLTTELASDLAGVIVRCLAVEKPQNCPEELWQFYWPAFDCLPAADVVVGGGGYHTVNECQALRIPLVVFPWSRVYDQQHLRVQQLMTDDPTYPTILVNHLEKARAAVWELLNFAPLKSGGVQFENGVLKALSDIKFYQKREEI